MITEYLKRRKLNSKKMESIDNRINSIEIFPVFGEKEYKIINETVMIMACKMKGDPTLDLFSCSQEDEVKKSLKKVEKDNAPLVRIFNEAVMEALEVTDLLMSNLLDWYFNKTMKQVEKINGFI